MQQRYIDWTASAQLMLKCVRRHARDAGSTP